jgi:type I restriction enzyme, S subunit
MGNSGLIIDGDWVESKDQDPNGEVRLIQLADIGDGEYLNKSARYLTSAKARELKCTFLKPGDVLISRMADPIGRACIFPGDSKPCVTVVDICVARPDGTIVTSDWLKYAINEPTFRATALSRAVGATRPRISGKNLQSMHVRVPSLTEQERVVDVLSRAESIVRMRREAEAKAKAVIPALFVDMFGDPGVVSQGACGEGRREATRLARLGDLADKMSDGPFGSNLKSSHYVEDGIRVIRLQNIGVGEFIDSDKAYVSPDHFASLPRNHCQSGDVVIGTLGDPNLRATVLPPSIPTALNKADCVQFRCNQTLVTPDYVCWLMNMPGTLAKAAQLVRGITRTRISMGRLRELMVAVPPLESQRSFARFVEQTRDVQMAQQSGALVAEQAFQSMLAGVFQQ